MKRKSIAQLRNELEYSITRTRDIDNELKVLKSGNIDGNKKTIERKIKDLSTERIKLQSAKKRIEAELEDLENV